ncbi:MAG: glycosyltransferase family 2 protein [Planctomycetota bacterium]
MTTPDGRRSSTIDVVIPSYGRADSLKRCLDALARQSRMPETIFIVVRPDDTATVEAVAASAESGLPVETVPVDKPGLVYALQTGLSAARSDVIAFTDDDAAPHADWVRNILRHFEDEAVGGVGGRDCVFENGSLLDGRADVVGRITAYGKLIGGHHLGSGDARDADILKGVNMSFRRDAIVPVGFDMRLRGRGAQVGNEVGLCLRMRRNGWRLIYDPAVLVDHFPATRVEGDDRVRFEANDLANAAHNEALGILEHFSFPRRVLFLVWATLIGTRRFYGIAQALRFVPSEGRLAVSKAVASIRGRWSALGTTKLDSASTGTVRPT